MTSLFYPLITAYHLKFVVTLLGKCCGSIKLIIWYDKTLCNEDYEYLFCNIYIYIYIYETKLRNLFVA